MSLREELLIPFQGAGEAGRDLWEGSKVLVGHGYRGLRRAVVVALGVLRHRDGSGRRDWPETAGLLLLAGIAAAPVVLAAGGAAARLTALAAPWIAGLGVVVWVTAAWIAAPPRAAHPVKNDHEKLAGEQTSQPDPEVFVRMGRLVLEAVADAGDAGLAGVHVAALRTMLADANLPPLEDVEAVHAWLKDSKFPVNRNLKLRSPSSPDGKNALGVRVDELTAVLGMPIREALALLDGPPHAADTTPAGGPPPTPPQPTSGPVTAPAEASPGAAA